MFLVLGVDSFDVVVAVIDSQLAVSGKYIAKDPLHLAVPSPVVLKHPEHKLFYVAGDLVESGFSKFFKAFFFPTLSAQVPQQEDHRYFHSLFYDLVGSLVGLLELPALHPTRQELEEILMFDLLFLPNQPMEYIDELRLLLLQQLVIQNTLDVVILLDKVIVAELAALNLIGDG